MEDKKVANNVQTWTPAEAQFREVFDHVVNSEFGTDSAFAKALGVTRARITQYKSQPLSIRPTTFKKILAVLPSPAARTQLLEVWIQMVSPDDQDLETIPVEHVLPKMESYYERGRINDAISVGFQGLQSSREYAQWIGIAERLHPLLLRMGRHSHAEILRREIETRASAAGDLKMVVAALAMAETALQSMDATTKAAVIAAQKKTLSALEIWRPTKDDEKLLRHFRALNIKRSHALQILGLVSKKRLPPTILETALSLAEESIVEESPDYVRAAGLEVKSRIEAHMGRSFAAEETIQELEEFGLHKSWEAWEKTRFALAKAAERRGEIDLALEILTETRDYCQMVNNHHHWRRAEQEIARIMFGIED